MRVASASQSAIEGGRTQVADDTQNARRVVVVGASSGLGRCIGIGLAQRGSRVALLARRKDRLDRAAAEAGHGALAVECDVTDEASCRAADRARPRPASEASTPSSTPRRSATSSRIEDTDAETWQSVFATNVTGAALATAAALPHLKASAASPCTCRR